MIFARFREKTVVRYLLICSFLIWEGDDALNALEKPGVGVEPKNSSKPMLKPFAFLTAFFPKKAILPGP